MDDVISGGGWPELMPLGDADPPEFPLECFPQPLNEYGRALAEYTQTDPAMTGVLLLGLLGAIFQNKYSVVSVNDNVEQTSIYAVAIAPPAERKSEVMRRVVHPLHEFESEYNRIHADDISRSKATRKLLEIYLADAEKGSRGDDILTSRMALDAFKERRPLTLTADDTTNEALVSLMADNGERILIASDEGGIFTYMKGRYKQNGDDTVPYLKGHSGGRITVHRKSREPETLENTAISMMIAVQPFVLENVIMEEANNGRGLTARLTYAVCAEKAGSRKAVSAPLTDETTQAYERAIIRCLSETVDADPPAEVRPARLIYLSDEARDYAVCWFKKVERRIADGLERAKAWNGKAFGLMMRIAGVFHAFECVQQGENPADVPLPEYVVVAAALVADCLAEHAQKVFSGSDKGTGDAKYLLRRLKEMGSEFGKRELWVKVRGRFPKSDSFDDALRVLEESGYIRLQSIQGEGAGRPLVKIQVNPAINDS